jgi:hypothetical protein
MSTPDFTMTNMQARPRPPQQPRPGPPERRKVTDICTRFRADGTRCGNPTDNSDGWCRHPDCPGYRRANPDVAPESRNPPRGTPKHVAETGHLVVDGIDLDDVPHLRITTRAVDSFRFHHGGGIPEAETELRTMAEDFLIRSARRISTEGYVTLAREGFEITLSPDRDALVGYRTVHKERTWTQVKAGVRSRIRTRKSTQRRLRKLENEIGGPYGTRQGAGQPLLDCAALRATADPATVYVSLRAVCELASVWLPLGPEEGREAAVRALIAAALADGTTAHQVRPSTGQGHDDAGDPVFTVRHRGLTWTISPDGAAVISVAAT